MKFKMLLIVIILALAAACSKKDKTEQTDTASTAPRDTVATSPVVASYRVFGNEPFWAVTINAEGLHFVSPEDTVGMHFPPVESIATGDTLRWTSKSDRGSIDVHVWPASCSDGMSDNTWSYASSVRLNEMLYVGCAEKK